MPYTPPGSMMTSERNHHRSRSYTDEVGPGAFKPIVNLPRRQPRFNAPLAMPAAASPSETTSIKSPKFDLRGGSSESDDDDEDDDKSDNEHHQHHDVPLLNLPEAEGDQEDVPIESNSLGVKTISPLPTRPSTPPTEIQIPFPTISSTRPSPSLQITAPTPTIARSASTPQIQSPSLEEQSPSIYRSPYSSLRSERSEPSTRSRFPLKPALKSNHSSPHLPSLAHQRALTQSAPSTPNLAKTAWASGYSSISNSGASTPTSIPATPKSVHFASEKGALEHVVVFTKGARPRSLSNPGGNDTETETEGYDSSSNTTFASRYPFPVMPNQEVPTIDESLSSQVPSINAISSGGMFGSEKRFVYLESLVLPGTKPPTLRGAILVRNIAFQKRVAVRFTLDDWQTTSEVSCSYASSLQSLPPPFASSSSSVSPLTPSPSPASFGHSKSASLSSFSAVSNGGKGESWDRFTFTIKLEDVERSLSSRKIFLVVKYQVPSQWGWETGGEWWDNNEQHNYEVRFKMGPRITSSSGPSPSHTPSKLGMGEEGGPSGLLARTAASLPTASSTTFGTRTQSLPPLPAPGPVRQGVGRISPNTSVLGLHNLKSVLPPLNTHAPPKLRAGRTPTFSTSGSGNSPPRSPTTYTPPAPGTIPDSPIPSPSNSSQNLYAMGQQALAQQPKLTLDISTVGKKRGLSLSNYVSPSTVKSPHSRQGSTASLASVMGGGGDGGERAYVFPKTTILGGMPATMMEDPSLPPQRRSTWDMPLKLPTPPETPSSERSPEMKVLPTVVEDPKTMSTVPFPASSPSKDATSPSHELPFEIPVTPPLALSSLGKRVSEQIGVKMSLDLPTRSKPSIQEPQQQPSPEQELLAAIPPTTTRTYSNASPEPPNSTSGPPAEFLAKYCFFVSSPGTVSPANSASPANTVTTSPSTFGTTGIDTPRASSPGLASAASAWWGYATGTTAV